RRWTAESALRQMDDVRRRVRPHLLQAALLVLHAGGRISLRRRTASLRREAHLGAPQQWVDAPRAAPEDDAERSGLSNFHRGPVARRAERRQAAADGESVHAWDERRDEREAAHAALHELDIQDL